MIIVESLARKEDGFSQGISLEANPIARLLPSADARLNMPFESCVKPHRFARYLGHAFSQAGAWRSQNADAPLDAQSESHMPPAPPIFHYSFFIAFCACYLLKINK